MQEAFSYSESEVFFLPNTDNVIKNNDGNKMMKLGTNSSYPLQTTYLELRSPPPPNMDITATTDRLSTSGDSGYFDSSSYSDLTAILESNKTSPAKEVNQQNVLTPAHTPENNSLDWTYLEPVQQPVIDTTIMEGPHHRQSNAEHHPTSSAMATTHVTVRPSQEIITTSTPLTEDANLELQLLNVPITWSGDALNDAHHVTPMDPFDQSNNGYPVNLMRRDSYEMMNPDMNHHENHSMTPAIMTGSEYRDDIVYPASIPEPPPPPPPAVTKKSGGGGRHPASDTNENKTCHVCGEKAGKHSYYGGQVCAACRAFFRRSVQSK